MAATFKNRNNVSTVGALIAPKQPKLTRNHMADNLKKLKEIESLAVARKEQEEMSSVDAQAMWTLRRFQGASSKIAEMGLGHKVSPPSPKDSAKENAGPAAQGGFLRRKPREDPTATLPKAFVRAEPVEKKPTVPKAFETVKLPPREERDFLHANAERVVHGAAKKRPDVDPAAPLPKGENYGQVPQYLRERQAGWQAKAEQEKRAAEESAACPPGHRLLPDSERLETLDLLKKSRDETKEALNKMPLRVEIPSALRRLQELEGKLSKLEGAITLFEKPKVYVKLGTAAGDV